MRLIARFPALILTLILTTLSVACASVRGGSGGVRPVVVTYRVVRGDSLRAHVFAPPSAVALAPARADSAPHAAVLLLHGGRWNDGEPALVYDAARNFALAGFVAIAIEYRLSDSTHTPIDALEDACGAIVWARAHADSLGFAPDRVAGYGVSAGGHLAAATVTVGCPFAAMNHGFDALALLSPALDIEGDAHFGRLLLGRATAVDLSPVAHGRAAMPPTMIVQGDKDTLTPLAGAQQFCLLVTATRGRCELRVYADLGHLLTRDLAHPDGPYDPDPLARADWLARQVEFLRSVWR